MILTYAIDITDSKLSARFVVRANSKPAAFGAVARMVTLNRRDGEYGPQFHTTATLGETMTIAMIGAADEFDSYRESADRRNRATFLGETVGMSLAEVSPVRMGADGPEVSLYGPNDEILDSVAVDEHRDFAEEAYNRQLLREQ